MERTQERRRRRAQNQSILMETANRSGQNAERPGKLADVCMARGEEATTRESCVPHTHVSNREKPSASNTTTPHLFTDQPNRGPLPLRSGTQPVTPRSATLRATEHVHEQIIARKGTERRRTREGVAPTQAQLGGTRRRPRTPRKFVLLPVVCNLQLLKETFSISRPARTISCSLYLWEKYH